MSIRLISLLLSSSFIVASAGASELFVTEKARFIKSRLSLLQTEDGSKEALRLTDVRSAKLGIQDGVVPADWLSGRALNTRWLPRWDFEIPAADITATSEAIQPTWTWVRDKSGGSWKKNYFDFNIGYQF